MQVIIDTTLSNSVLGINLALIVSVMTNHGRLWVNLMG